MLGISQNGRVCLEKHKDAAQNVAGLQGGHAMKNLIFVLAATVLLAGPSLAQSSSHSTPNSGHRLYKWVDDQGVTHYGDRIPPEYAAQEGHVINGEGIEVARVEAQKSPEQLAREDQMRADAAQSAARDRNLLDTYVSVQEIEHLRDQRLSLLADQIKVTSTFLEQDNAKLNRLRNQSMRFRPYSADPKAPPMTDQMAEDLVRLDNDIHTQEENLKEKRTAEATMKKQFANDIARFKELKGIH